MYDYINPDPKWTPEHLAARGVVLTTYTFRDRPGAPTGFAGSGWEAQVNGECVAREAWRVTAIMRAEEVLGIIPVVWIALDGVFQGARGVEEYAWDAEGEIIEAKDEALRLKEANPDSVVTLVVGFIEEGSQ